MDPAPIVRFENSSDSENTFVLGLGLTKDGGVAVSVSDEMLECDFYMTKEQAITLREWLIATFPPTQERY